jgi:hypothetical protein
MSMGSIKSQEHADLMAMFERQFKHMRLDKEPKNLWPKGHVYQNGEANSAFLAYRCGYAYGLAVTRT